MMVTIIGIIILAVLGYALFSAKMDEKKREKNKQELLKKAEDRRAEKFREAIKAKSAQGINRPPVEIKTEIYDGPVYASAEKEKERLTVPPKQNLQGTGETVLFKLWDEAIVLVNNKLYYRDESNIFQPITAKEAYEKEIWYHGYQAEQDIDRGGMKEEEAFRDRGFFLNDKDEWEYGGINRYMPYKSKKK